MTGKSSKAYLLAAGLEITVVTMSSTITLKEIQHVSLGCY